MKLRRKQSQFSVLHETKAPVRPLMKAFTIFYLVLLIAIMVYLVFFFVNNYITVEGTARVELVREYAGAGVKGVVRDIFVAERQRVAAGTPLARLSLLPGNESRAQPVSALERERLRKKREVNMLKSRLEMARTHLAEKRRALETMLQGERLERALELRLADDTGASRLTRDLEDLQYTVRDLEIELHHERAYLRSLDEIEDPLQQVPPEELVLESPVAGAVVGIFKGIKEFLGEDEVLLAITPDRAEVRIRARFPLDDLGHLWPGRDALLILPDGTELDAKLGRIYAAASRLRDAQWGADEKTEQYAEVEILPGQEAESFHWDAFNTMIIDVKVAHEWFRITD